MVSKKMIGIVAASLLIVGMVQPASAVLIWHSYDATIRTVGSGLIRGDILDADTGAVNAELKFYTSADVLGVAEAASVTTGGNGLWSNTVCQANGPSANYGDDLYLVVDFSSHWRIPGGVNALNSDLGAPDWFIPFVAMSTTDDLSFNPPSTWGPEDGGTAADNQFENHLVVIAFVAPQDGEYEISNFGARALQPELGGGTDLSQQSVHIIDDRTGLVIEDSVVAGGDIGGSRDLTWKLSGNTTTMNLSAGDEIHFAVHSTALFQLNPAGEEGYYDATSVAFDITLLPEPEPEPVIPEPSTFFLLGVGVSLAGRRRRKRA